MSHRVLRAWGLACCLAATSCTPSNIGTNNANVTIEGAGETFLATLYQKWFTDYHAAHPGTTVRYPSKGGNGQNDCEPPGLIPLPDNVRRAGLASLDAMGC